MALRSQSLELWPFVQPGASSIGGPYPAKAPALNASRTRWKVSYACVRRPLRRELIVASRGEGGEDALARELGAGLRRLPDIHDDDLAGRVLATAWQIRAELLQNVYELAVLGEGDPIPPDQQPWWDEMREAERLEEALRLLVDNVTSILALAAPLDDFVRAASFDPDPARVRAHSERLRRESYAQVVEHLDARFGLRPGLTPTQATGILLLLLGPATYQTLVGEYGWSQERWRSWCAAARRHR